MLFFQIAFYDYFGKLMHSHVLVDSIFGEKSLAECPQLSKCHFMVLALEDLLKAK